MALFDDPKKELRRLEEQLLAEEEEYPEETLEELLEEYSEEGGLFDGFEDEEEYAPSAPQYRNFANDYGRAMTEALWEEEQEEEPALYRDDYEEPRRKKKKKTGFAEVIFLILLDILLIFLLYWGWTKWMG